MVGDGLVMVGCFARGVSIPTGDRWMCCFLASTEGHTDLSPEHPAVVLAGRFPRLKVSCLQRQEVGASQSATQAPKS